MKTPAKVDRAIDQLSTSLDDLVEAARRVLQADSDLQRAVAPGVTRRPRAHPDLASATSADSIETRGGVDAT